MKSLVFKGLLVLVFILMADQLVAQTRYVVWFTPSGAEQINGIAVGLMASAEFGPHQQINGINAEVGPWGALMFLFGPIAMLVAPFNTDTDPSQAVWSGNAYLAPGKPTVEINGINLSVGGHGGDTEMNAISLNGVFTQTYSSSIFSAAMFMNFNYQFTGMMMSMRNKATTGSGFMLGFFNNCSDCHGLQIGLLNKMGNGKKSWTLPLINFRFGKKPRR